LAGFGPFLGAICVTFLFKVQRKTTIFGRSTSKSLLIALIQISLFTIIGAANTENLNSHYYGLLLGIVIVGYCIFEETGWRGYLQDELRGINPFIKYFLIGFMWYFWHLTLFSGNLYILNEIIILSILILASWGIGQAVEYTHSIVVAACLHSVGNIMAFSSLIKSSMDFNHRIILVLICIVAWILILVYWDKKIKVGKSSE
jgi:membrane protease YdiL (CAAX protease family)